MPEAVGRPRGAFAVEAQPFFLQNRLEELALPLGKNQVGGSGRSPCLGSRRRVIGPVRARGHALEACWARAAVL